MHNVMYSEVGSDMSLEIVVVHTLSKDFHNKNHQNWLFRNNQISSFKGPENHNIPNTRFIVFMFLVLPTYLLLKGKSLILRLPFSQLL